MAMKGGNTMTLSEARYKANRKYDDKAYKRITVRIPRAIEEQLNNRIAGGSFNGYLVDLIKKDLGIETEKDAE